MRKLPFGKSSWPKPNKAVEAALGRFIIAWNVLEQQMDFAIQEITGTESDMTHAITANLGTKAKLDMYQALAHLMSDFIGDSLTKEIEKLAGETANASGELRNFIFHGQPVRIAFPKGDVVVWLKRSARKGGVRGSLVRWNGPYVEKQVATVKALIARWEAAREKAHKGLSLYYSMPDDLRYPNDEIE